MPVSQSSTSSTKGGESPGSHNRRTVLICCGFLFLLAIALAALLVTNGLGGETFGSKVAVGLLVALVITAVLGAGGVVWAATRSSPAPSATDNNAPELVGARRVFAKSDLDAEDWFAIPRSASSEFYVVGHTLGRWCSASNREELITQLSRILGRGGRVTLVLLGIDSPPLHRLMLATGVDYTDRVRESMTVLDQFRETLPAEQRRRLTVAVLRDHEAIPYMIVGNERRLIAAPYFARSDSRHTICVELDRGSRSGAAIYDDLRKLAERRG